MLGSARVAAILPVQNLSRARQFYEGTLGLRVVRELPDVVLFEAGGGTMLGIYERPPVTVEHTQAAFVVDNLDAEMRDLRAKGVRFEDYDLPNLRTENGVARQDGVRVAWFKDPDGNILAVEQHSGPSGLSPHR